MALDEDLGLAVGGLLHLLHAPERLLEVGGRELTVVLAERIPLEALEALLHGGNGLLRELLGLLRAGEPAVRVARHGGATLAADQLPHGDAEGLALDIPERHIDSRERAHEHGTAAPVGVAVVVVPERLDVHRVLADEAVLEVVDGGAERRLLVLKRAFADAVQAFVGLHLHEHPVRAEAVDNNRLQRGDLHFQRGRMRMLRK